MKPRMTKWFDGSKFVPAHVGEYNASFFNNKNMRRWWDGKIWSSPYFYPIDDSGLKKIRMIKTRSNINFRGLKDKS